MNAPEMIRQHADSARAVENLAAIFYAHNVESLVELGASIFMEFDAAPGLEVVLFDGSVVKTAGLDVPFPEQVGALLVCHEGREPTRLDLTAYAAPADAVLAFGRMAEGVEA